MSHKEREKLPERPRSHQLDDEACLAIRKLLAPHVIDERGKHDYGKDMLVELVDYSTPTHKVTGRSFSVQVKGSDGATEHKTTVKVRSINSWFASLEPILLVKIFSPEKPHQKAFATWIDAELKLWLNRTAPEWQTQDTVTIPLKFELSAQSIDDIERHVTGWRPSQMISWEAQEFAAVEKEAEGLASELLEISLSGGVEGPVTTLRQAAKQLARLSYSVALLGNSRVGKSTLMNHLLGRDLSPVQTLPTTAVVMSVSCGEEPSAIVHFLDGRELKGAPSADFLAPFMTQQQNPDNGKQVGHVEVRLPDRFLAAGIRFLDLPGFHDADPQIRAISEAALDRVNACIYMVDVAPYLSGSFSFSEHHVTDITALLDHCDRVLLVLSKADLLNTSQREDALAYINEQLKKYALIDRLAAAPTFLGIPNKAKGTPRKKSPRWLTAAELRDCIWTLLLQKGEVATARAHESLDGIISAHDDLARACSARLLEGNQARALLDKLTTVEREVEEIGRTVESQCATILSRSSDRLKAATQVLVSNFDRWIRSIPSDKPLPSNKELSAQLYTEANRLFVTEQQAVGAEASAVLRDAELRIKTVLEQLPIGKLERQSGIGLPQIPEIAPFPASALERVVIGAIGIGVAAFWACTNPWTAALTVLTFLFGSTFDAEKARAADIEKRAETVRKLGPQIAAQAASGVRAALDAFKNEVIGKTQERGRYALHDLRKAITHGGKSLSPKDAESIKTALARLGRCEARLKKLHARVMRTTGLPIS